MKVLLLTTDLFRSVGGGQTVYQTIVRCTPEIEFFYFADKESNDAPRPLNAHPIRLAKSRRLKVLARPPFPLYQVDILSLADRFALSVAGQCFDIVDVPDFYVFGRILRDAFAYRGVTIGRMVIALHGTISRSLELEWGSSGDNTLEARTMEKIQFESADGAYAISPRYAREWQSEVPRDIRLVDPAHFVNAQVNTEFTSKSTEPPALYCIGRKEKRKGNDLFVELVRWLRPRSYSKAEHIGEKIVVPGYSSEEILRKMAAWRNVELDSRSEMRRDELLKLYSARSVVVLPVRYDTLNLITLEALFSGCPVAVSSRAGVCDYLDEKHPHLPYAKLDLSDFHSCVSILQDLADNYDEHRGKLIAALRTRPPAPPGRLNFGAFYESVLQAPPRLPANGASPAAYAERAFNGREFLLQLPIRLPKQIMAHLRKPLLKGKRTLVRKLRNLEYFGGPSFFDTQFDAMSVRRRLEKIAIRRERNQRELRDKLDAIYAASTNPLYRGNFWLDIARLERLRGNDLLAATYELRMLRLMGDDRFRLLSATVCTLEKHGFALEARAARAMYAEPATADDAVYALLKESERAHRVRKEKPFQILDDRRSGPAPTVSVIVSLYKAADKLQAFLARLAHQTLIGKGAVEIILVDSGSPTDERGVLLAFLEKTPLNVVYARSAERETIQAAWNRGIGLSRAPYLCFLGVDETLYPEALEVLAESLDRSPEVDWVMANSLVTAVDDSGLHSHDIMPYDRTGGTKDHVYLETCYLSWVGGLYRRTIHDRFGYYDETFGAAGDTEFKNRILPHIEVRFVPKTLGLFLNYPDGQTTASPRAEIEDLRAWYLHRSRGGVRYAFENRLTADAERLLHAALGYRKSYCGHQSSDIEYAIHLAYHLRSRDNAPSLREPILSDLEEMLRQWRALEVSECLPKPYGSLRTLWRARRAAEAFQARHRALLPSASPSYGVFNDNRYEQHSWLWKS